jgi:hypothetical protein
MKIEYPVFRYNIFNYVYVLSFYNRAKHDKRFLEALNSVKIKLSDNMIVIESVNRKLKDLLSCRVNEKNEIATQYYNTIINNLNT